MSDKPWKEMRCEVCGGKATEFTRDMVAVDRDAQGTEDGWDRYEPGEMHCWCAEHAPELEAAMP
jgi:hypothetical protein